LSRKASHPVVRPPHHRLQVQSLQMFNMSFEHHEQMPLYFGDFGPFENDPDGGDPTSGSYFGDTG